MVAGARLGWFDENIYAGTSRGLTEAPHFFKRNGYYYLTTAEGGTGYQHAVTLSWSRNIWGPYEDHPDLHVICEDGTGGPIQRTGHGQYVETHWGGCYHTFLMGRPSSGPDGGSFCPLGRESGIDRVVWRDDWMYLERGRMVTGGTVAAPVGTVAIGPLAVHRKLGGDLPLEFQWLRTPEPDRIFREDTNSLTLVGREGIGSWFEQALVARRQEHHVYAAETTLDFAPLTYQQAAGLTTYYNAHKYHAIVVTHDAKLGRVLSILSCLGDWPDAAVQFPMDPILLMDGPVTVRVTANKAEQQFWYLHGKELRKVGPVLDASVISDEGGKGEHASFTGAFVGMIAFDITGQGAEACFTQFDYIPKGAQ